MVDITVIFQNTESIEFSKRRALVDIKTSLFFPENVKTIISYGANIQATITYMHTRRYLPFERMSEYFKDVCNVPISQGTICNLLDSFALKAQPAYDLIAQKYRTKKLLVLMKQVLE